jgi:hypothetical protein
MFEGAAFELAAGEVDKIDAGLFELDSQVLAVLGRST